MEYVKNNPKKREIEMKKLIRLSSLMVIVLALAFTLATVSAKSASYNFNLGSTFGDRDEFTFEVATTGTIRIQANWNAGTNLALILNGPGQTGYYQRIDGSSPLVVTQAVTNQILAKGTTWRASIVNFSGGGNAWGNLQIDYPAVEPMPVPQSQNGQPKYNFSVGSAFGDRDSFSFEVTTPGTIQVQANWPGGVNNLALILNGPGQTGYYQRSDGHSPLVVTQVVTNQILAKGTTWQAAIVNLSGAGNAAGTLTITYPIPQPVPTPNPGPGQGQGQGQGWGWGNIFWPQHYSNFDSVRITDIEKTMDKAVITVAYTLATNHQSQVFLGANTESSGFGYKPAALTFGTGTAKVELSVSGKKPLSTETISVFLYEGGKSPFFKITQDQKLNWNSLKK